jgi:hypothetical protein
MIEIALTILGVGITLLACAVTYLAWRNGKVVKENTTLILQKMDEDSRIMGERMDRGFRELGEKMDEGFRLIALLILAETPEEKKDLARRILREKGN